MPDNNLTDKEIVKALECCSTYKGKCTDCPAFVKVDRSNCKQVLLGAIEIINRQKEEIERLKKENNILSQNADTAFQDGLNEAQDLYAKQIETEIKSEARKEFAESIKDEITDAIINNGTVIKERIEKHNADRYEDNICLMCDGKVNALIGIEDFIDNLLKEMESENK